MNLTSLIVTILGAITSLIAIYKVISHGKVVNALQTNHIEAIEKAIERMEAWQKNKSILMDEMNTNITKLMTACKIKGILDE